MVREENKKQTKKTQDFARDFTFIGILQEKEAGCCPGEFCVLLEALRY
jgi:hypothetical protein